MLRSEDSQARLAQHEQERQTLTPWSPSSLPWTARATLRAGSARLPLGWSKVKLRCSMPGQAAIRKALRRLRENGQWRRITALEMRVSRRQNDAERIAPVPAKSFPRSHLKLRVRRLLSSRAEHSLDRLDEGQHRIHVMEHLCLPRHGACQLHPSSSSFNQPREAKFSSAAAA